MRNYQALKFFDRHGALAALVVAVGCVVGGFAWLIGVNSTYFWGAYTIVATIVVWGAARVFVDVVRVVVDTLLPGP